MSDGQRSYLFLSGVPRSGTTTLTELLGAHRHAAIGIERFKKLLRVPTQHRLAPSLFTRERFFDVRDDETNIRLDGRYADYYAELRERFDDARVFGDKVPTYYYLYHHFFGAFPGARVVCILRNPFEVASSWNRRAKNPADAWGADQDAKRSVGRWNECLALCARARAEHPGRFVTVEHARLFGGDEQAFVELSEAVGLPADASDRARHRELCAAWLTLKDKPLDLDATEIDAIASTADFDAYERLTGTRVTPPVARA